MTIANFRAPCALPKVASGLAMLVKCLVLVIASGNIAVTAESARPQVTDEVIDTFIDAYRDDPAALMHYAPMVRNASVAQMRRTIHRLGLTHFSYLYPMVISGAELSSAHDVPLERLSLMAVRGGKLIAIPFQFDEFNHDGLIWIDGQTPGRPAGTRGALDQFDELAFMYRDGGEDRFDAQQHGQPEGKILKEIRLEADQSTPRYAYLVKDNPQRSEARYVDVSLDEGRIESTVLKMHFDRRNLLGINHVESRIGPHAGENVFDNIHIALSTGILNRNLRFSLDTENNIRVVPRAVAAGPIRNTMLLRVRIWYLGMPTLVSQDIHAHFYEQGVVIPMPFAVDSVGSLRYFVSLLREPRLDLSVDFHNLDGAKVTFASVWRADQQALADYRMSDFEVGMNYARMPGDWLHLDSGRGWQMFFVNGMPLVEGGLFDQFMEGSELNMVYRDADDIEGKSIRYNTVLPRIGFRLSGLPAPAMELLAASPRMPRRVNTLGEALLWMADDPNRLNRYDEAANRTLSQLKERGLITTAEQLAEAFIVDMSRMRFTGLPRDDLDQLMRDAIIDTVTDVGAVRHGEIIARMAELAQQRNIRLQDLRQATIDNALWFPDSLGSEGPLGFHREVSQPPRAVIKTRAQLSSNPNPTQH